MAQQMFLARLNMACPPGYAASPSQKKPKGWVRSISSVFNEQMKKIESSISIAPKTVLKKIMQKAWRNQRELRILVSGKTGQGKSTLINGILGDKVADEGARATRCTTEVNTHAKTIEGVPVKVFDSPGLQDRTEKEGEYIKGMIEQCKALSLVLYCTKMTNPRLTDDDKNSMMKLTKAFGEHFWDYAVLVLTFANMEDVERHDDRDEDEGPEPDFDDTFAWEKLRKKRFEGRVKAWKNELQRFLIDEVGVSEKIACNIPVVPTGDRKKTRTNRNPLRLPDRDNWFHKFWEVCCVRVKDTRLFLKVNSNRMVSDEDKDDSVSDDDDGIVDEDELDCIFEDLEDSSKMAAIDSEKDDKSNKDDSSEQAVEEQRKDPEDFKKLQMEKSNESQKTVHDKKEHLTCLSESKLTKDSHPKPLAAPPRRRLKSEEEAEVGVNDIPVMDTLTVEQPRARTQSSLDEDLVNAKIHMDRELVSELVEQSAKRAGFSTPIASAAKEAIQRFRKPVMFFKSLFEKN